MGLRRPLTEKAEVPKSQKWRKVPKISILTILTILTFWNPTSKNWFWVSKSDIRDLTSSTPICDHRGQQRSLLLGLDGHESTRVSLTQPSFVGVSSLIQHPRVNQRADEIVYPSKSAVRTLRPIKAGSLIQHPVMRDPQIPNLTKSILDQNSISEIEHHRWVKIAMSSNSWEAQIPFYLNGPLGQQVKTSKKRGIWDLEPMTADLTKSWVPSDHLPAEGNSLPPIY